MKATDIPGFEQLTTPERILLVEEIWESLAVDEASVPVPDSHIEEVRRRLARHRAKPGELLTLQQLQKQLESSR